MKRKQDSRFRRRSSSPLKLVILCCTCLPINRFRVTRPLILASKAPADAAAGRRPPVDGCPAPLDGWRSSGHRFAGDRRCGTFPSSLAPHAAWLACSASLARVTAGQPSGDRRSASGDATSTARTRGTQSVSPTRLASAPPVAAVACFALAGAWQPREQHRQHLSS